MSPRAFLFAALLAAVAVCVSAGTTSVMLYRHSTLDKVSSRAARNVAVSLRWCGGKLGKGVRTRLACVKKLAAAGTQQRTCGRWWSLARVPLALTTPAMHDSMSVYAISSAELGVRRARGGLLCLRRVRQAQARQAVLRLVAPVCRNALGPSEDEAGKAGVHR
jgi:hypothetical protein